MDINYKLIIAAKLVKNDGKLEYKFILDTQFLSKKELTYDEMKMICRIIDILEFNRKFVLSKFKKYTLEEYDKECAERERKSEMMLEALKKMIENKIKKDNNVDYYVEEEQ